MCVLFGTVVIVSTRCSLARSSSAGSFWSVSSRSLRRQINPDGYALFAKHPASRWPCDYVIGLLLQLVELEFVFAETSLYRLRDNKNLSRVSFTDFLQHIKFFEFVKRDEYILYKLESKEINLCLERYKEFEESYNSIIDFLSQFSVKDGEISFIPLLDFIPEMYTKICSAFRVSFHGDLLKAISVIVKDIIQRNSSKTRYLNPDFLYEKTSEIFG